MKEKIGVLLEKFEERKGVIVCILVVGFICFAIGKMDINEVKDKNSALSTENELLITKYEEKSKNCEKLQTSYKALEENTKIYTELTKDEKEIVDTKIKEVKQATDNEKARIKAEQEAAEKAKKEAAAQAAAERVVAEKAKKEAEEESKKEAEAQKYNTGITWEDIARDNRTDEYCQFVGEIIQVMNGDTYNQYRIKIDNDYDKIMLIEISNYKISSNLIEGDSISFKGKSAGNMTYTTVMGAEKTIPAVIVDEYSIN